MAGAMGHFDYVSDNGNTYSLRLNVHDATAAGLAASSTIVPKPGSLRPRYVLAVNPSNGKERKIVVNPTSALWIGTANTITLTDFSTVPSADRAFSVNSREGEKRPNR